MMHCLSTEKENEIQFLLSNLSDRMHKETSVKLIWIATTIVVLTLCLHGCKVPGMHQPEIEQGNIVTQKMVDRLRPKMTKAQVEFVLGRPVYQNTFDINRWDYVYTREGRTGERVRRLLTLRFADEVLVGLSGDYRPEGEAAKELEALLEPSDDSDSNDESDEEVESVSADGEEDAEDEVADEEENTSDGEDEVKVYIPNR